MMRDPSKSIIPIVRMCDAISDRLQVWLASPAAAALYRAGPSDSADERRFRALCTAQRRIDFAASRALRARVAPSGACSLSHSAGYAALAHAPAGPRLGVDLEHHTERDFLSMARFAFAPEEAAALEALQGRARARRFYTLWVMKESMAKALGLKLIDALRHCVFTRDGGGWRASVPERGAGSLFPCSVWVFEPRPDTSLAVARLGGPLDPRLPLLYEWPPPQRRDPSSQIRHVSATWPVIAEIAQDG